MIKDLKGKLMNTPFDIPAKDDTGYPANERGYFRMYFRSGAWEGTSFPIHAGLGGDDLVNEFCDVINSFRKEFKDLESLNRFCRAVANERFDFFGYDRWILYLTLDKGNYEFDVRTMPGDYNLYLRCYAKEGSE